MLHIPRVRDGKLKQPKKEYKTKKIKTMENNNDKRVLNIIANGETVHSVIGTVSQVKQAIEDYKTQTSWDVSYSTNKTGEIVNVYLNHKV